MIDRKIKPSIELKKLGFSYNENMSEENAKDYIDKIGVYPFVVINGLILEYTEFVEFKLFNDQFMPRLEMKFRDGSNRIIDPLFPLDDSIISVFIRTPNENVRPIRMDFKITHFNPNKKNINKEDVVYSLKGILDVNVLYHKKFVSIENTSYNVLKQIAQTCGLGFASNIENTNDKMVWINPAENYINFIKDITDMSYRDDESFLWSYVDFYYNLNYIDIETQYSDGTEGLRGVVNNTFLLKKPDEETGSLLLTNHPDAYSTDKYISKYDIMNESTSVNLKVGYVGWAYYYDKLNKNMNIYELDTISNGTGDNIVLKSNSDNSKDSLYENATYGEYMGEIDSDNMHENFYYAKMQNRRNIKYFQKVKMKIILTQPNFNIYRFQMIKVKLYKMQELDDKTRHTPVEKRLDEANKNIYEDKLNKRLSGEWMVSGINYRFSKTNGWEQDINVVRRELGNSELR